MSTLKQRDVKAVRKPHTCDWCGERIEAGQPAEYSAGFNEEERVFWSCYFHPECAHAWSAFWSSEASEDDDWEYRSMPRGGVAARDTREADHA